MVVQRGNEGLQIPYYLHRVSGQVIQEVVLRNTQVVKTYKCVCWSLSLINEVRKEYLEDRGKMMTSELGMGPAHALLH